MSIVDLSGKVAVVTGSGGGIGRAVAIAMARASAAVIINDIGASLARWARPITRPPSSASWQCRR